MKEIYVGNLAYAITETELRDFFSEFGNVTNVKLIKDRATGQSKGYAFIEFATQTEAENTVKAADGKNFKGRPLKVNISRQKGHADSDRGGGGRSGGRGGW